MYVIMIFVVVIGFIVAVSKSHNRDVLEFFQTFEAENIGKLYVMRAYAD